MGSGWREDATSVVLDEPHDIDAGRIDPRVPGHEGYREYFLRVWDERGHRWFAFHFDASGVVDEGGDYEPVMSGGMLLGARLRPSLP